MKPIILAVTCLALCLPAWAHPEEPFDDIIYRLNEVNQQCIDLEYIRQGSSAFLQASDMRALRDGKPVRVEVDLAITPFFTSAITQQIRELANERSQLIWKLKTLIEEKQNKADKTKNKTAVERLNEEIDKIEAAIDKVTKKDR